MWTGPQACLSLFSVVVLDKDQDSGNWDYTRDTGNDFFVPQFSGGSVTFPGTRKALTL